MRTKRAGTAFNFPSCFWRIPSDLSLILRKNPLVSGEFRRNAQHKKQKIRSETKYHFLAYGPFLSCLEFQDIFGMCLSYRVSTDDDLENDIEN